MATTKEEILQLIQKLPADVTSEDIQYHIYVREKIGKGLKDFEAGRVLSQAQVEEKMAKWLQP
jgi:predicted transcriptional regulator